MDETTTSIVKNHVFSNLYNSFLYIYLCFKILNIYFYFYFYFLGTNQRNKQHANASIDILSYTYASSNMVWREPLPPPPPSPMAQQVTKWVNVKHEVLWRQPFSLHWNKFDWVKEPLYSYDKIE